MSKFAELMKIDINNLEVEWLMQPQVYAEYGEYLAEAKKQLDRAKEELELVKAQLDEEIRKNPDLYGLEKGKVTETRIERIIIQQPEYQKLNRKVIKLKHEVEVLKVALAALEHKKSALENLIKLLQMQYFAPPTLPHTLDEINTNVASRLRNIRTKLKIYESLKKTVRREGDEKEKE